MKILVTGATGYIGGAVAEAMQKAGLSVHGLAHTGGASQEIERRGWTSVSGELRDPAGLERVVGAFDAVVHAANSGGADAAEVDTEATRAFLRALRGSGKPFIYTSGAWVLGAGISHEGSAANPAAIVAWRASLEREVLAAAPGVRTVVIRPGIVYGRGGGIPGMVGRGELPVIGDGAQRWPLVHVEDLADLYVRALGSPEGSVLHGVAASASMRDLAHAAGADRRGGALETVTLEEARLRLGIFADALALDQDVSARRTRDLLGWQPRQLAHSDPVAHSFP